MDTKATANVTTRAADRREHLAGYDLVDCESIERAEAIAAGIPDARLVAVEVRPVMDLAGWEM